MRPAVSLSLDSILKHLASEHDVLLLVWARYVLHVFFVALRMAARDDADRWQTGIKTIHLVADSEGGRFIAAENYEPCAEPLEKRVQATYAVPADPPPIVRLTALTQDHVGLTLLVSFLGTQKTLATRQIGLHAFTGFLLVFVTVFMVLARRQLPMAQTYPVTFSTPLIATL